MAKDNSPLESVLKGLAIGAMVLVVAFVFFLNVFLGCNTSTRDD